MEGATSWIQEADEVMNEYRRKVRMGLTTRPRYGPKWLTGSESPARTKSGRADFLLGNEFPKRQFECATHGWPFEQSVVQMV